MCSTSASLISARPARVFAIPVGVTDTQASCAARSLGAHAALAEPAPQKPSVQWLEVLKHPVVPSAVANTLPDKPACAQPRYGSAQTSKPCTRAARDPTPAVQPSRQTTTGTEAGHTPTAHQTPPQRRATATLSQAITEFSALSQVDRSPAPQPPIYESAAADTDMQSGGTKKKREKFQALSAASKERSLGKPWPA